VENAAIEKYGGILNNNNPYQAYGDGSASGQHPVRLVAALYEGALDATRTAARCFESRDIQGRTKAINKAVAILTELLVSLDFEKGGEISRNLKRLYSYMQTRLLEAHTRQAAKPLGEVEKLLATLIEGWSGVSKSSYGESLTATEHVGHVAGPSVETEVVPYGAYFNEPVEAFSGKAFSF
jgi:flagellar secretion chaperone FliS